MLRIAIVLGSTRPGRRGQQVSDWALTVAERHVADLPAVRFEVVDLADEDLPLLNEVAPARTGRYGHEHTQRWAERIAAFDGFVFVTPEYNHSFPAPLKNAIDYLYAEWADKAAGFISYGVDGGTRAVEHLRLTLAELKVATVRAQTVLQVRDDFDIPDPVTTGRFIPRPHQGDALCRTLDEVIQWSAVLQPIRESVGESIGVGASTGDPGLKSAVAV